MSSCCYGICYINASFLLDSFKCKDQHSRTWYLRYLLLLWSKGIKSIKAGVSVALSTTDGTHKSCSMSCTFPAVNIHWINKVTEYSLRVAVHLWGLLWKIYFVSEFLLSFTKKHHFVFCKMCKTAKSAPLKGMMLLEHLIKSWNIVNCERILNHYT